MEKKQRARAHHISPFWRVFEVRWTPKESEDIRKRVVKAYIKKNQYLLGFIGKVELDGDTLIMRVRAAKKEDENSITQRLIVHILTALQRQIAGARYSFIDSATRIQREDCEIRMFNLYTISGDNLIYPIKMIGLSEKEILEILKPRLGRDIENREIKVEELLANDELPHIIRTCNKTPCWRATPKPTPAPKEEKPLGKYSKKRVKHEGQGNLF